MGLGLAAEHGYFMHWPGGKEWAALNTSSDAELQDQHARWQELIQPIMQVCCAAACAAAGCAASACWQLAGLLMS